MDETSLGVRPVYDILEWKVNNAIKDSDTTLS